MLELTIKGTVYQFKFGLGFVREINPKLTRTVEGVKQEVGLQFAIASILDQNPVELAEILSLANKTEHPRVNKRDLDEYIEAESTDLDALFEEVLDFLRQNNATKMVEAEKAKAAE